MSTHSTRLLHVEDDIAFQQLVAHYLTGFEGADFHVTCVTNEEDAVRHVADGGVDLVILDYALDKGSGLNCVHRIRGLDSTLPIVVLSGVASNQVAGELLKAGADDFLAKQNLSREAFLRVIGDVVTRANRLRQLHRPRRPGWDAGVDQAFQTLCLRFLESSGRTLSHSLDEFESLLRRKNLTPDQIQRVFDTACGELARLPSMEGISIKRSLRPIFLELLVRLFGSAFFGDAVAPPAAKHPAGASP